MAGLMSASSIRRVVVQCRPRERCVSTAVVACFNRVRSARAVRARRLGGSRSLHSDLDALTVVLDMDETLIHSRFLNIAENEQEALRQAELRQSQVRSVEDSFEFVLPGDMYSPRSTTVAVNRRPHLRAFLEAAAERWKLVIFTAATQDYADHVLNVLDPAGDIFAGRLYRQHCTRLANGGYVKDLTTLAQPSHLDLPSNLDLGRTVLVDNSPSVFLPQPFNGIPIASFYDDEADVELTRTLELLDELDTLSDVRRLLASTFHGIQFDQSTGRVRVQEMQKLSDPA
jgi:Dullard-like phosphatase family protein